MKGDHPEGWQEEIVSRYSQLKTDLGRAESDGSEQTLVFVLREGAALLRDIVEDGRLWEWIDAQIARAQEEAPPEAFDRIMDQLDEIVDRGRVAHRRRTRC